MTLRRKTTKKGGFEYANVSDKYNLLEDAIKSTGGYSSYADVNSSYMLNEKKGGNLLQNTTNLINVLQNKNGGNKHYKKGGNIFSSSFDLMDTATNLFKAQQSPIATPAPAPPPKATATTAPPKATATTATTPPPAPPKATATTATTPPTATTATLVKKGGRRGGCSTYADINSSYMISDTNTTAKGGCGCRGSSNRRNGGAVELAPFAAAVALMAARYMTDVNNFDDIIKPSSKSSKKPSSKSSSKSSKKSSKK
jgi:hypothetical protein